MGWRRLRRGGGRSAGAPDYSWVTERLAVGRAMPSPLEAVRAGFDAVIDVRAEADREELHTYRGAGLDLLWLPVAEHQAPEVRQLAEAARWARDRLAAGDRLLIQCREGIGRSAAVALAILVAGGLPPQDAYTLLKRRRPVAGPSSRQLEAVLAFVQAHGTPADEALA